MIFIKLTDTQSLNQNTFRLAKERIHFEEAKPPGFAT